MPKRVRKSEFEKRSYNWQRLDLTNFRQALFLLDPWVFLSSGLQHCCSLEPKIVVLTLLRNLSPTPMIPVLTYTLFSWPLSSLDWAGCVSWRSTQLEGIWTSPMVVLLRPSGAWIESRRVREMGVVEKTSLTASWCWRHARVAQRRQSVLPVPVGDSNNACCF